MKKLNALPAAVNVLIVSLMLAWALAGCAAGSPISPTSEPPNPLVTSIPPAACPPAGTEKSAIPFSILAQGYRLSSSQAEPMLYLAADPASLDALEPIVDTQDQALLGEVKEDSQVVLAAFWGVRPSGGASITICAISIEDSNLTVSVILQENDPNLPRIDAATYPYHLVLVNRLDLPREVSLHYRLVSDTGVLVEGELP